MNDQTTKIAGQSPHSSASSTELYLLGVGAIILFASGFLWLGWGYGWVPRFVHLSTRTGIAYGVGWLALYLATAVLLAWAVRAWRACKARLRGASVTGSELWHRRAGPFKRVLRYEWMGCTLVFMLALVLHRWDLLAVGISLVVGLHFLPLAALFRAPVYYATAAAVIVGDVLWLALLKGPAVTVAVGTGTGVVLWITAIHLLLHLRRRMREYAPGIEITTEDRSAGVMPQAG